MKDRNRIIVLVVSLVLLIVIVKFGYDYLSGSYTPKESDSTTIETKLAKDFTVYDEEGNTVKLSDFKGKKPVLINIWASWCGPCKAEMPYFEEAIKKYGDEVEILMVNLTDGQRETKEKALKFLKDNNLEMDVVFDEDLNTANAYNVRGIPRTIFINIDGEITYDREGLIDEDMLRNNIKKIISQ
ncbi:TlpA disulfide reductase family protein [Clostridium sp. AL.422]|uniref:TlpA family protein disulfide reductase n=1 Tax=Clostridium TaxID=1485 RepID=UPI00293DD90F|nr:MULTISPECIES: TlpA disulfide reductase family protein [unclassified Clostridium]MDV4149654.1 TlpA disulfide reductase family protein [Clostridium sp. AL.422]